jgi:hypothetical protein
MTLEQFIVQIQSGLIFTVTFKKRSTGEIRTMNCRYGVEKHLAGGDLTYNPIEKGLIVVYDLNKQGYRQIPIEGIVSIVLKKQAYNYNNETKEFEIV